MINEAENSTGKLCYIVNTSFMAKNNLQKGIKTLYYLQNYIINNNNNNQVTSGTES